MKLFLLALLQIYLCTQLFEAIVKLTKGRFQTTKACTCTNHWIHALFEQGFYLKVLKTLFMGCQAASE